jgi:tight adherence protein B
MTTATLLALSVAASLLTFRPGSGRLRRVLGGASGSRPRTLLGHGVTDRLTRLRDDLRRLLDRDEADQSTVDLLSAVGAELRAGAPPDVALRRALAEVGAGGSKLGQPQLPATTAALKLAGDVAAGLRADAGDRRNKAYRDSLFGLGVCWQVSGTSGAGLGDAVARLAQSERSRAVLRRELRAELAGPKATAVLLAMLPAAGIMLGTALGAKPLAWLLKSPLGWVDLAVAGLLVGLGLRWVRRIINSVERR